MYTVRNNTQGKVILGDLNLIINFQEEVDLDKRFTRDAIEKSSNLKHALSPDKSGKSVLTLINDVHPHPPLPDMLKLLNMNPIEKTTTIFEATDNSKQLAEMEERLRKAFTEELNQIKSKPANTDEKIDMILQAIKSGNVGTASSKTDVNVDFDDDEDKMSALHKKVIERISKNSSAQIQSEDKKIHDSDVANKADELEGLI